jgi:hypothetical protein
MHLIGKTIWCVAGGNIPPKSTGREPECTSHEKLCFLNAGDQDATAKLTMFYEDRGPIGPYSLTIKARRCRHVRVNDLIEPEAVPLDTNYSILIECDLPIIVQFNHFDSSSGTFAVSGLVPYSESK